MPPGEPGVLDWMRIACATAAFTLASGRGPLPPEADHAAGGASATGGIQRATRARGGDSTGGDRFDPSPGTDCPRWGGGDASPYKRMTPRMEWRDRASGGRSYLRDLGGVVRRPSRWTSGNAPSFPRVRRRSTASFAHGCCIMTGMSYTMRRTAPRPGHHPVGGADRDDPHRGRAPMIVDCLHTCPPCPPSPWGPVRP